MMQQLVQSVYLMLPTAGSLTVQLQVHSAKLFAPALQAARAYDAAAVAIRGPSAKTNFKYPFQLLHLKHRRGKVGAVLAHCQCLRVFQCVAPAHMAAYRAGAQPVPGVQGQHFPWAGMPPASALSCLGLGPATGVLPSSCAWHLLAWTAHWTRKGVCNGWQVCCQDLAPLCLDFLHLSELAGARRSQ